MRLILIRHGKPERQSLYLISLAQFRQRTIAYDATHLSQEGIRDIEAIAQRLPLALILSSDLPRAKETAEIIRRGTATVVYDSMFRELQAPTITTRFFDKLQAPPTLWSLMHWCCWVLGIGEHSEGPRAAWGRAAEATAKILSFFRSADTIILVSHGWFIILLTVYLRKRGLIERGPLVPDASFGGLTEYRLRTA